MLAAVSAAAAVDLCKAIIALEIIPFLDPQPQLGLGADPASAQAPLLESAVELLLPLAALAALFIAVVVIYLIET